MVYTTECSDNVSTLKAVIDEFEQRVEETHTKGVADDAVAQKASKASHAAKTVKGSKTGKTPGTASQHQKHLALSSSYL